MSSTSALSTYLDDHLAGATAGLALARRAASSHAGTPAESFLRALVDEIADDRVTLIEIQRGLGLGSSRGKAAAGWVSEKVARLKLRHFMVRDRRLSRLLELETLGLGIAGKAALWTSLKRALEASPPGIDLGELIERAERQRAGVERYRVEAARAAFD